METVGAAAQEVAECDSLLESRRWLRSGGAKAAWPGDATPQQVLKVLTMNVLADGLGLESFVKVPSEVLSWRHRGQLLVKVLLRHDPDVICLQELNRFPDVVEPVMLAHGFEGKFAEKTISPCEKFGMPKDGCAVFYRASRFRLIQYERVPYGQDFTQVYQVLLLCERVALENGTDPADQKPDLIVICTHLKAKSDQRDVRVAQTEILLARIHQLRDAFPNARLVVAGDFNADPTSDTRKLLEEQSGLFSAYAPVERGANFYTTWKVRKAGEVRRTIDYIFHSGDLETVDVLLPPTAVPSARLPCEEWPSDHVSLVAVLRDARL